MIEDWVDLVPELRESGLSITGQQIRSWSLVLSSQYITHRAGGSRGSYSMMVRDDEADQALRQIRAYESENADWAPQWLPSRTFSSARASFSVLALVALVHFVTAFGIGYSRSLWLSVGSADKGLILAGEWWRLATALTLHADIVHLASNIVIGGFFVLWLCQEIGGGLGWLSTLAAGIAGNFLNALAQSPLHNSIGASTALFGTIGILSGLRAHESASSSRSVVWPLVAGMIFLSLLGAGGERTDVGAHLFGLVAGVAIGVGLASWLKDRPVPGPREQRLLALSAILIPLAAWIWGFNVKV